MLPEAAEAIYFRVRLAGKPSMEIIAPPGKFALVAKAGVEPSKVNAKVLVPELLIMM